MKPKKKHSILFLFKEKNNRKFKLETENRQLHFYFIHLKNLFLIAKKKCIIKTSMPIYHSITVCATKSAERIIDGIVKRKQHILLHMSQLVHCHFQRLCVCVVACLFSSVF